MKRPLKRRQRLLPVLLLVLALSCAIFMYKQSSLALTSTLSSEGSTVFTTQHQNSTQNPTHQVASLSPPPPPPPPGTTIVNQNASEDMGPYQSWDLFAADFQQMMKHLKIFVYPEAFSKTNNQFSNIFLPLHQNPLHNPKLGNYLSEHMFKISLLHSPFLTLTPRKAHFFYLPFSINNLRNDPRVRSEQKISEFVANYTDTVSHEYSFWNASGGADHFYVCCHSVGRDAVSKHHGLHNNAIQLTCSSSYFQRFYVSHKDVGLPQVWPRPHQDDLNPPHSRNRLVFFSGRVQNSQVRQQLMDLWENDTDLNIYPGNSPFSYEEGFKRSKYCLHVKGYEVNTARVSDAIHYGCIPVIVSNYYDLPFANVLDWTKFSIVINQRDIRSLKMRLLGVTREMYLTMFHNLCKVRRHFVWHTTPRGYDSFYMTAYQLWLRRRVHRLPYQETQT